MKTVLITGASRGIGRATALEFAGNGYKVGFTYLNSESDAISLVREFTDMNVMAHGVRADASDPIRSVAAIKEIEQILGPIEVLINNAGISMDALFTDIDSEMWDKVMSNNLKSVYNACHCVLPGMISRQSGSIINVSSVWGTYGAAFEAAYSASKGGIAALTKALAKEAGPNGIRVNAVAPGVIDTSMISGLTSDDRSTLINKTPLLRLGTPEDVAKVIVFLASPAASFITGQIIGVDGGFTG